MPFVMVRLGDAVTAGRIFGRYVEDPRVRSMRVRAWYQAVVAASRLSARDLEEKFSGRKLGVTAPSRSCIWTKYRRGEVVPRAGSPQHPGLAERVEVHYPGTAVWLSSPLWRLVDMAPLEMREIRQIYEGLPKLLRSIFVEAPKKPKGLFWRRPVDVDDACDILLRFGDVDALIALLAMVREAETTQDAYQHSVASHFVARHMAELCSKHDVIDHVLGRELHDYVRSYSHNPGYIWVEL